MLGQGSIPGGTQEGRRHPPYPPPKLYTLGTKGGGGWGHPVPKSWKELLRTSCKPHRSGSGAACSGTLGMSKYTMGGRGCNVG